MDKSANAEARYQMGTLDEVVTLKSCFFHLEQMDKGCWHISLDYPDGTTDHITLSTARGAKINGRFEADV